MRPEDELPQDEGDARAKIHKQFGQLYRAVERLEHLVSQAVVKWPEDRVLRIVRRHLREMLEDLGDEGEP